MGEPLVEVDETAPLRPDSVAAYSATKAEAEQLVLDADAPGFTTVSIRPRFVWGPGSSLIGLLADEARQGRFAWIDGGRHTTDVTYVDNAVAGLLLGWRRGRPGQAYFITDGHRVVLREFLETLFALYGVASPTAEVDGATAEREIPAPARWFLGQECTLRIEKAVDELGYAPAVSRSAGLEAVRAALAGATTG